MIKSSKIIDLYRFRSRLVCGLKILRAMNFGGNLRYHNFILRRYNSLSIVSLRFAFSGGAAGKYICYGAKN